MTTIAANLKEMGSDSQLTWGGTLYEVSKIFRVKAGLLGTAGHVELCSPFEEAMRLGKPPKRPEGVREEVTFAAILLTPHGLILFDDFYNPMPVRDGVAAIGTGADVALSWLKHGATLRQAIERACEVDHNSGLPVVVESLTKRAKCANSPVKK